MKVPLCFDCHRFLHRQFSNRKLANELNTLLKIRSHPMVDDFITERYHAGGIPIQNDILLKYV